MFFKPSPQIGTSMLVSSLPLTCIVMVWTFLCVGVCEAGPSLSSFLSPPRAWRAFGVWGEGGLRPAPGRVRPAVSDAWGGGPQPLPSHLNQSGAAPLHCGPAPPPPSGCCRAGRAPRRGGAGRSSRDLALYQDLARGASESVAGGRRRWPVLAVTGALG